MIIEKLENFGVIKEAKEPIEIKPLTIFMGDNSSGKSYLAMLVYGLLEIFWKKYDSIQSVNTLFKDYACVLKLDKFLNEIIENNIFTTTLKISLKEQKEILNIINYFIEKDINILSKKIFNTQVDIDKIKLNNTFLEEIDIVLKINYDTQDIEKKIRTFDFYLNDKTVGSAHFSGNIYQKGLIDYIIYVIGSIIKKNIIYLPASRTGFMQTYKNLGSRAIQGFYSNDFEMQERQILNTPTRDFLDKLSFPKNYEDNRITSFIEKEILRGEVLLDKDSNDIEFKLSSGEVLPIHALSSTITELMPLVIFLKRGYIKKNTLLIIEEPEAHLSFKNQRLMAKIIAMLLSEGVKVLITTHSDFLVYEIDNLIKKHSIKNSENFNDLSNKIQNLNEDDRESLIKELEDIKEDDININPKNVSMYNFLLQDDGKSIIERVKDIDEFGLKNEYIFENDYAISKEKSILFDIMDLLND